MSINSNDTSISRSKQLEIAVPMSIISSLSAGEFVGMVADNPNEIIDLKTFHATLVQDHVLQEKVKKSLLPLPPVRKIENKEILTNYFIIKEDVKRLLR